MTKSNKAHDELTLQLEQVKERVAKVLEIATSLGADGVEVAMTRQQGLSVGTRLGEVENVEFIKMVVKVVHQLLIYQRVH